MLPKLTSAHQLLLAGLRRYVQQSWDAGIAMTRRLSLVEAHKVAYFLQRAGLDLSLRYDKGHFGPYAPDLDRFISAAEGHYVQGYGDGTGGARADLWLLPDGEAAANTGETEPTFQAAWEKVSAHVDGYEYPDGMELLASIDFVCRDKPAAACTTEGVRNRLGQWSPRKKRVFAPDQIKVALTRQAEHRLIAR